MGWQPFGQPGWDENSTIPLPRHYERTSSGRDSVDGVDGVKLRGTVLEQFSRFRTCWTKDRVEMHSAIVDVQEHVALGVRCCRTAQTVSRVQDGRSSASSPSSTLPQCYAESDLGQRAARWTELGRGPEWPGHGLDVQAFVQRATVRPTASAAYSSSPSLVDKHWVSSISGFYDSSISGFYDIDTQVLTQVTPTLRASSREAASVARSQSQGHRRDCLTMDNSNAELRDHPMSIIDHKQHQHQHLTTPRAHNCI